MDSSSDLSELSSELSSIGSTPSSPPSPYDYPSPISSQDVNNDSSSQTSSRKRTPDETEAPPVTKRRKIEPKPRITQYLNLNIPLYGSTPDQSEQLALLTKLLRKRRKIVVIAGAGISTSAGIPDFRSKAGLFTTLKNDHNLKTSGRQLFDASVYQTDEGTAQFHSMVRSLSKQASAAEPTAFHHLLASLANKGQLMRLYTQNVDDIDTSLPPLRTAVPLNSKGPWPRTIQLHGGLKKMVCSKCHLISEFEPALFDGPVAPECSNCTENDRVRLTLGGRSHGIGRLRPRIVLYNEQNPDDEAIGAVVSADLRARPDAVIVVGTSMKIPGVKRIVREMCGVVRSRRDGIAVWLNQGPPPPGKELEDCWDLVIEGSCDSVAEHAAMKRWDDTSIDYEETTESDAERAKKRDGEVRVVVGSPSKGVMRTALLTPAPSPKPVEKAPVKVLLGLGKFKKSFDGKAKTQVKKQKEKRPTKPKTKEKVSANGGIKRSFKTTKSSGCPAAPRSTPSTLPKPFANPQSPPLPALHPPSPNSGCRRGFVTIPPTSLHTDLNACPRNRRVTPPPSRQPDSPPPQLSPNTLFRNPRELPALSSISSPQRLSNPAEQLSSPLSSLPSSPPAQNITPLEHLIHPKGFRRISRSPLQSPETLNLQSLRVLSETVKDPLSPQPLGDNQGNQAPEPHSPSSLAQKTQLAPLQPMPINSAHDTAHFSPFQDYHAISSMPQRSHMSPRPPTCINLNDHPSLFRLITHPTEPKTPSTPSRRSLSSSFRRCSTPDRQILHDVASPITPPYSVLTAFRPKERWRGQHRQQCAPSPTPCSKTKWVLPSTPERQIIHNAEELATPQWSVHSGYRSPSSSSSSYGHQQSREISPSPLLSPSPPPSPLLQDSLPFDSSCRRASPLPPLEDTLPFNSSFRRVSTLELVDFEYRYMKTPDWSPISSRGYPSPSSKQ